MSLTEFLASNPDSSEAQVRDAISGNICQCTGYQSIVASALVAARVLREAKEGEHRMNSNSRFIGVVGTIIVVLIGIALYQKISKCSEEGGKACCFGRFCNPGAGQTTKGP